MPRTRRDDILREARIVAVEDVNDALVSDRPYRWGIPPDRALAMFRDTRGTRLDADLVDLFLWHEVWRTAPLGDTGSDASVATAQEIPSTSRA